MIRGTRTCLTCARPFTPTSQRQRRCPKHQATGRASRSPTTQAQDAEYYAERKRILASDPDCHWCRREPATTADHVIPVAQGGGHRGNLVPACAPCNYSRQANPNWRPKP